MGLNLHCNGQSEKCAYSFVHTIRLLLLRGLLKHVINNLPSESELIAYLKSLDENDEVQYQKFNTDAEKKLSAHKLQGFSSFIFYSDSHSFLSAHDAKKFMETWKITHESMDESIKWEKENDEEDEDEDDENDEDEEDEEDDEDDEDEEDNDKYDEFYFQTIFVESIESGNLIHFC